MGKNGKEGYIYVLSNESMPGIVKIGRSIRSGRNRARELYSQSSGVPTQFVMEFEVFTHNCFEDEADIHSNLESVRVNQSREFFRMSVKDAVFYVSNHVLSRWHGISVTPGYMMFTTDTMQDIFSHPKIKDIPRDFSEMVVDQWGFRGDPDRWADFIQSEWERECNSVGPNSNVVAFKAD